MRLFGHKCSFLCLVVFAQVSFAQGPLTQASQSLIKFQTIKGQFKQKRRLSNVQMIMESSGHFTLDKKKGLLWKQENPFLSEMRVNKKQITMKMEKSKSIKITAQENPMLFLFSHAFLSLFRGDVKALKEQFDVVEVGTKKAWKAELSPKNDLIKKAIKKISVSGDSFVRTLEVEEQSGNGMKVSFSQIKGL